MKKRSALIKSLIYLACIGGFCLLRAKGYTISSLFLYLFIFLMAIDWLTYWIFGRHTKK